jgi:hypothetical protein
VCYSHNHSHATFPLIRTVEGNADGLGETRKKELMRSGVQLGLRGEDDILVVEDKYILCTKSIGRD